MDSNKLFEYHESDERGYFTFYDEGVATTVSLPKDDCPDRSMYIKGGSTGISRAVEVEEVMPFMQAAVERLIARHPRFGQIAQRLALH